MTGAESGERPAGDRPPGWIVGQGVGLTSVIPAALLWSSRQL